MERQIDLKKNLFTKQSYKKVIDTDFKNLGTKPYEDLISDYISIEEFFRQYNLIFYDIPKQGNTMSHEYLALKSGEYSNFDKDAEIIGALQDEIAQLRKENLKKDLKILELETGEKIDPNITSSLFDEI